ncbi:uncharacterized protein LOC143291271 [Babylonia areolata]|uniref:uncharacterized protein LOC143291271 n=1 Tax=Babylonia areolata TaxID=304850 RepID=UPI003FD0B0FF
MSQTPTTRRQLRERDSPSVSSAISTVSGSSTGSTSGMASSGVSSSGTKIRTRLSTGTLIMNGTSTIKEKDTRTPPPTPDASRTLKDTPATGLKRRAGTAELPVSPLPKQRRMAKSDGSACDPYCWLCHKDDCSVTCQLCPRSYHPKCLMVATVPKNWVCGECERLMEAECLDTRSNAMKQISTDMLSVLMLYALDRMKQPGSEVFQKPANPADLPMYSDVVVNPMDFSTLEKNIKKKEYGCTESFLADAKWILHNCVIYNGAHHKLTAVARNIVKSCKHEMAEIEVCPQCYKHSCIRGEANWFIEPCDPPHPLVWAKLKGYPFWPAKAMEEVNDCLDVRFFGAHDKSVVPISNVFMLSKEAPTCIKYKKGGFADAMVDVKAHIEAIRKKYGTFEYAPFRTPYDKGHVYMSHKMMASKHFKVAAVGRFAVRETEKVSATSKTASAVKIKYSSMASKKSTTTTTPTKPSQGLQQQGFHQLSPLPSSPETAEKAIRKALSDCGRTSASKSRFINPTVSVTDIIQQKMQWGTGPVEEEARSESGKDMSDETKFRVSDLQRAEKLVVKIESSPESGEEVVGKDQTAQDKMTEEKSKDSVTAAKGTSKEQGSDSKAAESRTAALTSTEKKQEKQSEKTAKGAGTGTAIEHKVPTDQEEKGQSAESCEDQTDRDSAGQQDEGRSERTNKDKAISQHTQDTNGKDGTTENPEKSVSGKKLSEEEVEAGHDLASKKDAEIRQGKEKESHTAQKNEETEAVAAADSVAENKETSDTVPSKNVKPATSVERSANTKETENNTVHTQCSESAECSAVKETASSSVPETAKTSPDASAEQSTATPPPASPSSNNSSELPTQNLSPQSAVEYKAALLKTIEACKGKLGITNVEEVQDPMEVSDDEESHHSQDDGARDGDTETALESQVSSDSQDSRISLDMEVDSGSCSTSKSGEKSDFEAFSEKTAESNTESVDMLDAADTEKCESEFRSGKSLQSDSDSVSGTSKLLNNSSAETVVDENSDADVRLVSKDVTSHPTYTSDTGMSKGSKPAAASEVHVVQDKSTCPNSRAANSFRDSSEVCSVETTQSPSPSQSRSGEHLDTASSVSEKVDENRTTFISQSEKPKKVGSSEQPKTVSESSARNISVLRQKASSKVVCAPLNVTNACRDKDATSVSSVVSSKPLSKSSNRESRTSTDTSAAGSTVNPITIMDDDEPTLLMEVETEAEKDDPLVINVDEDDHDKSENECIPSQKSNRCGFVKELAPSEAMLKSMSKEKSSVLSKKVQEQPRKKVKVTSSGSRSSVVSSSTSSQSLTSEPCEMMICDVRSLSGTFHEWKEDSSKQPASLPKQPQLLPHQQSLLPPKQSRQQSLQQQHVQPQPPSQLPPQPLPQAQQQQQQFVQQKAQHSLQHLLQQTAQQQPQPEQQSVVAPVELPQSQPFQHFRMPPTPPVEQSQQRNSASPSTSSKSAAPAPRPGSVDSSNDGSSTSTDRAAAAEEHSGSEPSELPTLSPAAVSLVNKYSQKIVGNMQLQLAEMSKELLASVVSERVAVVEERAREEREQLEWTHEMKMAEVQHSHKITVAEMKACWEAEMSKALQDLRNKLAKEKQEAVMETKKKQWCASCWKEALYYCCWNTSYCSYTCQQAHWSLHQQHCRQVLDAPPPDPSPTPTAVVAAAAATPVVAIKTVGSDKGVVVNCAGDKTERIQVQKFNVQTPHTGGVNTGQGASASSQGVKPRTAASQSLQHVQYLQGLASSTSTPYQAAPQVQIMGGQRPVVNTVIPSSSMMFPIVRHGQSQVVPTSQNLVINAPIHYVWKN